MIDMTDMTDIIEISSITETLQHIDGLEAVIFDLDDTLYSEKDYVRSGYNAVAKHLHGIEDAGDRLYSAFEAGKPAIDEVLAAEGVYTDELKDRCLREYRLHTPQITLYRESLCVLEKLQQMKIPVGIITDGRPEGQWAKIKALGVDRYAKYIIVTDELGGTEYRKPCEKAFCRMAELFSLPFNKMCYVGDNINKDFAAPQKLGMRAIWFKNTDGIYYNKT